MNEKTLYELILEKLGVEEGEEFNIYYSDGKPVYYNPYYFKDGYIYDKDNHKNNEVFFDLFLGKIGIKKLPWKPKKGDKVYYVSPKGYVIDTNFSLIAKDLAMAECGWFFRTEEEAEANKDRILLKMKEVMQ